jgi:hypothetical protein
MAFAAMSSYLLRWTGNMLPTNKTEWESQFRKWAEGPGDTESTRCDNAEKMVRKAIAACNELKGLDIEVFSQGSFRNVTNIPQESDVDVSVCLKTTIFYKPPDGAAPETYDLTPSDRSFKDYRQSVVGAIKDYFGTDNVSVGNKAVRVHSNTYRVGADVVPNWLYREYFESGATREGVKFIASDGAAIINYPKQHIDSGVAKNLATKKRFKRVARIMKSLQVAMLDDEKIKERSPSFFLESLVYNVPNDKFGHNGYFDDVQEALRYIYLNTRPDDNPKEWVEVNNVKYLLHSSQPWTKAQANAFALTAWNYVGVFK